MGLSNEEMIQDLKFVVDSWEKIDSRSQALHRQGEKIRQKYLRYWLVHNRIAILALSVLVVLLTAALYGHIYQSGLTFKNEENLVLKPVEESQAFKEFYQESARQGGSYTSSAREFVAGELGITVLSLLLPLILVSVLAGRYALFRILFLSCLACYYGVLITVVRICREEGMGGYVREYVLREHPILSIFGILVYLISAAALFYQWKHQKTKLVEDYRTVQRTEELNRQYEQVFRKYGEKTENLRALFGKVDRQYSCPPLRVSAKKINVRKDLQEGALGDILEGQEEETKQYLLDLVSPKIEMSDHVYQQYMNAIQEILSSIGWLDPDISRLVRFLEGKRPKAVGKGDAPWMNGLKKQFLQYQNSIAQMKDGFLGCQSAWERFQEEFRVTEVFRRQKQELLQCLESLQEDLVILPDVRLRVEKRYLEPTVLVCSPWGIFLLCVQNIESEGDYEVEIKGNRSWSKGVRARWKEMGKLHLTKAHQGIAEIVRKKMKEERPKAAVYSVAVFPNCVSKIKNRSRAKATVCRDIFWALSSREKIWDKAQVEEAAQILKKCMVASSRKSRENWMKEIVSPYDTAQKTFQRLKEEMKPLFDLFDLCVSAFGDQFVSEQILGLTLSDRGEGYRFRQKEPKKSSSQTSSGTSQGGTFGGYQNWEEDEFDRAFGNCEMGNSYSYSWYDEDYNTPTWER